MPRPRMTADQHVMLVSGPKRRRTNVGGISPRFRLRAPSPTERIQIIDDASASTVSGHFAGSS
eukprot:1339996-Pyramimonas_sp.AAC.1